MEPLISIVIPVYNVEKYLAKCLESVMAQTYRNFEAVLVDDGSTDRSGEVCEEYAGRDGRFKAFHKENGGLSDARNYGVERASGELVSFVDSDDYVAPDYLEYLWHLMEKHGCDVSGARPRRVTEGEAFEFKAAGITEEKADAGRAIEIVCYTTMAACAKLYKRELLLKQKFPKGRLYEDIATTYRILARCGSAAFSDREIYAWVQREGSITHEGISERQLDVFWALDGLWEFVKGSYPMCKRAASYRYVMDTIDFLTRVFSYCNGKERKKYFAYARRKSMPYLAEAARCKEASYRFKMAALGIYCGYIPYKAMNWARSIQKGMARRGKAGRRGRHGDGALSE